MPDASTPDVSVPGISTPDISTPDASVPDISTPDISTPDISPRDVSPPNEPITPSEQGTPTPITNLPPTPPTESPTTRDLERAPATANQTTEGSVVPPTVQDASPSVPTHPPSPTTPTHPLPPTPPSTMSHAIPPTVSLGPAVGSESCPPGGGPSYPDFITAQAIQHLNSVNGGSRWVEMVEGYLKLESRYPMRVRRFPLC
jgi:hypothetical protein